MALTFTNTLSEEQWILSDNNNIITFSDDIPARKPLYCDITITGLSDIRIFPLPDKSFYFNFKEYLSSLLNDYSDDINYSNITTADIQSFIFNYDKVIWNDVITLVTTFDNNEIEIKTWTPFVLLGAEQEIDFRNGLTVKGLDEIILSPFKINTNNRHYLKYWDGYPLDFAYTQGISTNTISQTIRNNTNATDTPAFNLNNKCNRIVISNGDTNQTLEDFVSLADGYNELELTTSIFIDLWKQDHNCGIYLKWLNSYGGWNYWLFNENNQVETSSRLKGRVFNDYENLGENKSPYKSLGYDSKQSIDVVSDNLNHDDINLLKGIIRSPKTYLFTGKPFSSSNDNDWLEIAISNKKITERDFKNNVPNVSLSLELPNLNTISL